VRFTLVTPVLNGMPYVPACIESIDAQRGDGIDLEHIVCDPGSTDGTREWLRAHAKHAELVFAPDEGQVDALERMFARARGDVLGWLNGDDILEPHALLRTQRAFEASAREGRPAVAVTGACLLTDPDNTPVTVVAPPRGDVEPGALLLRLRNLMQASTFFTRDAFRAVGGFDHSLDLAFDADLFRRLAQHGRVLSLPTEVLSRFRLHPGSKTERNHADSARQDLRSRRKLGLPLASYAALTLAKRGYLYPLLPAGTLRAARKLVGALRG
jgi:glycosyltransferase involved in cell wall biosynthesis